MLLRFRTRQPIIQTFLSLKPTTTRLPQAKLLSTMASEQAHKLCMIPGPIEFHEDVLSAMSTPGTSHVDPNFIPVFGESLEMLRRVLLTQDAQPFVLSGSGTLGWDAMACNLMEAGDHALVVNTGYFGDRFGLCCETYGFQVRHVRPPILGDVPSMAQVEQTLKEAVSSGKPFKLMNITQVDTSTGVLTDVKALSELCHRASPSTLVIVDGVCSIGGEELRMDDWGIDGIVTASQKALGTPSGLLVMLASQRAMNVFKQRKTPVNNYYASWTHWLPIMQAYENRKPSYFATPAVSLIIALHVSLKQVLAHGMDHRFKQHQDVSKKVKDALTQWGLRLVPVSRSIAANTLTAVYYPDNLTAADLLPKVMKRGVVLAGGLHPEMVTKYFRIGHMGISACEPDRKHIDTVLEALESALKELVTIRSDKRLVMATWRSQKDPHCCLCHRGQI